jgi:hypothetical protein
MFMWRWATGTGFARLMGLKGTVLTLDKDKMAAFRIALRAMQ